MNQELQQERKQAFAVAYRMLGSVTEAEDIVQETLLRLHRERMAGTAIESPTAYVTTVATRLAIDHLRSARVRREAYTGAWLPEPVVGEPGPAAAVELAESLSMAFLQVLEKLTPLERAVFLLREVFDYDYSMVASIVGKSEGNCRQILVRARHRIEEGKPRFEPSREKREELMGSFMTACAEGNLDSLVALLAEDVTFHGDGGGKAMAVAHPITGRESVAKLMMGLFRKGAAAGAMLRAVEVNGQPGAMTFDAQGLLVNVFAVHIAGGKVQAIQSIVNPDKLSHLGLPLSSIARLPAPAR